MIVEDSKEVTHNPNQVFGQLLSKVAGEIIKNPLSILNPNKIKNGLFYLFNLSHKELEDPIEPDAKPLLLTRYNENGLMINSRINPMNLEYITLSDQSSKPISGLAVLFPENTRVYYRKKGQIIDGNSYYMVATMDDSGIPDFGYQLGEQKGVFKKHGAKIELPPSGKINILKPTDTSDFNSYILGTHHLLSSDKELSEEGPMQYYNFLVKFNWCDNEGKLLSRLMVYSLYPDSISNLKRGFANLSEGSKLRKSHGGMLSPHELTLIFNRIGKLFSNSTSWIASGTELTGGGLYKSSFDIPCNRAAGFLQFIYS